MKRLIFLGIMLLGVVFVLAGTQTSQANPAEQAEDQLARGEYIANIARCISCHTPDQERFNQNTNAEYGEDEIRILALSPREALDNSQWLAGGRFFSFGEAGSVTASNITPDEATGIGSWTEAEIKTAIQTGVSRNGRRMHPIMPAYNTLAEEDLDALVAYLLSVEPISNEVVNDLEVGAPPATVPDEPIVAPTADDKSARGSYLVGFMGCAGCHTPTDPETGRAVADKLFAGRQPFNRPYGTVYAGNITPHAETGIGEWSAEEIKRAINNGVRVDGRRLALMPWQDYARLTPEDLDAIVYYLQNDVPAVENSLPTTALAEPYVQYADGNGEDEAEEDNTMIYALVAGLAVFIVGGAVLFVKRRKT